MSVRCGTAAKTIVALAAAALGGCAAAPVVPPAPVAAVAPVAAAPAAVPVTAAPAAAACTLPGFLGLTPVCAAVGQDIKHKVAFFGQYFPCLEPTPPLLPLTDPANLASSVPAIAAAAEIKAEQDMAPQKIKALKYLATIGCAGCYPGVEEAFLAALADCTEEVRFEAVKAIYATAGSPCVHCNSKGCCSPKLRQRLAEIAFEGSPCPKEPSARVRRMARIALNACGAPPPAPVLPAGPTEVIPEPSIEPIPPTLAEPVAGPPPTTVRRKPAQDAPPTTAGTIAAPQPAASPAAAGSKVAPRSAVRVETPEIEANAHEAIPASGILESGKGAERAAHESAEPTAAGGELPRYSSSRLDHDRTPATVRWESVSVGLEQFASVKDAVVAMDYVRRKALGEEATPPDAFRPELVTARRHDWTRREEIASEPVAAALFSTPAGSVSEVLTDGERLMLVRVVERREARNDEFAEAAARVREELLAERRGGTPLPPAPPVATNGDDERPPLPPAVFGEDGTPIPPLPAPAGPPGLAPPPAESDAYLDGVILTGFVEEEGHEPKELKDLPAPKTRR